MIVNLILLIVLNLYKDGYCQSLTNTVHKTQAAAEKINKLWCYVCDTMEDGEMCSDILTNSSSLVKKCKADEFVCMVKRFSYTTSTENSTSSPKMWSLERKCAVKCESGCIVIGERTKLYACTSCCENSLCNIGRGGSNSIFLLVNYDSIVFNSLMKYIKILNIISITLCTAFTMKYKKRFYI